MAWLGSLIKKLGGYIKSFVTSSAVKSLLRSALGKIVTQVVTEIEKEGGLRGDDARKEAIRRIGEVAAAQGVEIKEKVRNLIIEIVVNKLSLAKAKL